MEIPTYLVIMPRCPQCARKCQNQKSLLSHMNQPLGSCHSHTKEIATIANELQHYHGRESLRERNPRDNLNDTLLFPTLSNNMDVDYDHHEEPATFLIEEYEGAGASFGHGTTFMDHFDQDIHASERQHNVYYPFVSKDEWELASFLLGSDLSMADITKFLSLKLVRFKTDNQINY